MRRFLNLASSLALKQQQQQHVINQQHLQIKSAALILANQRPLSNSSLLYQARKNSGGEKGRKRSNSLKHQSERKPNNKSRTFGAAKGFFESLGGKGEQKQDQCDSVSSSRKQRKMSLTNECVEHDKSKHRFTMNLGDNMTARIDYKPIGRGKIELYHTEVPEEFRGRGIGKHLAKATLDHVSKDNLKVKLTCSYLVNYLDKFADPKYKKLVVEK